MADPNRSNNTLAATTGLLDVTLPSLTLGAPLNDTFTAADQDHYYQVTVPAGGTLQSRWPARPPAAPWPCTSAKESCPRRTTTRKRRDLTGSRASPSTYRVLTAGTYYILVHSISASRGHGRLHSHRRTKPRPGGHGHSSSSGGNGGNVDHRNRRHQLRLGHHGRLNPGQHHHQRHVDPIRQRQPDCCRLRIWLAAANRQLHPERPARSPISQLPPVSRWFPRRPGFASAQLNTPASRPS